MKLTIFGATGGIGAELLEQAIAAGHEVTAAVRNPRKLDPGRNGRRVVTVDLEAPGAKALESAIAGADAVLSGVGPRPMAQAGVAERGTREIVRAMQETGVRRPVDFFDYECETIWCATARILKQYLDLVSGR